MLCRAAVLFTVLIAAANCATNSEIDDCLKQKHDDCLNNCVQKLPEDKRAGIKDCIVTGYNKIHDGFESCMETQPDAPCWKKPSYEGDDKALSHSPERDAGPNENEMIAKLRNLNKCEKDCVKNARNSCMLACDSASGDVMRKLRKCKKTVDTKQIKDDALQCITTLSFGKK